MPGSKKAYAGTLFGLDGKVRTGVLTLSQRRRLTKSPANRNTLGKAGKRKKAGRAPKARKSGVKKRR